MSLLNLSADAACKNLTIVILPQMSCISFAMNGRRFPNCGQCRMGHLQLIHLALPPALWGPWTWHRWIETPISLGCEPAAASRIFLQLVSDGRIAWMSGSRFDVAS